MKNSLHLKRLLTIVCLAGLFAQSGIASDRLTALDGKVETKQISKISAEVISFGDGSKAPLANYWLIQHDGVGAESTQDVPAGKPDVPVRRTIGKVRMLMDFEKGDTSGLFDSEGQKWATISSSRKHATSGTRSAKVVFKKGRPWSTIEFKKELLTGWKGFDYLAFDIYSEHPSSIRSTFELQDHLTTGSSTRATYGGVKNLEKGKNRVLIDLRLARRNDWARTKPSEWGRDGVIHLDKITKVKFWLNTQQLSEDPVTYIDNVRLLKEGASESDTASSDSEDLPETELYLHSGQIRLKGLALKEGKAQGIWLANTQLQFSRKQLRAIEFHKEEPDEAAVAMFADLLAKPGKDDVVIALSKKSLLSLEGELLAIDATHLTLRYKGKDRRIGREKVHGVVLAEELSPRIGVTAKLSTGEMLSATTCELDKGKLTMTFGESTFALSWSKVGTLLIRSPRLAFLGEMNPTSEKSRALAGPNYKWRKNRSVLNKPLRLGKEVHASGVGTHAECTLTYDIPENAERFVGRVGLDPKAGAHGNCIVRVLVDGKEVWNKKLKGTGVHALELPIKQARQFTISVEAGENYDIGDHVNWGSPRFILKADAH